MPVERSYWAFTLPSTPNGYGQTHLAMYNDAPALAFG